MITQTQTICIENIPSQFRTAKLYEELPRNGGNVIHIDKNENFSNWLISKGFKFPKNSDWEWLVVFR